MTKVQICGVTSMEDALMCEEMGADAIGFVSVESRRRNVQIEKIKGILEQLGPFTTKSLIGFPENSEEFIEKARYVNADMVQLYTLNVAEIEKIKQQGFGVIRAVHIDRETGQLEMDINEFAEFARVCDVILFEPSLRGRKGGIGLKYDYEKITPYVHYCKRFSIAGGLAHDNVQEALKLNPYAVHVSSGIESEIGKKDGEKVKAFIKRCK